MDEEPVPLFVVQRRVFDAECGECNNVFPVVFWCETPNFDDHLCPDCLRMKLSAWATP